MQLVLKDTKVVGDYYLTLKLNVTPIPREFYLPISAYLKQIYGLKVHDNGFDTLTSTDWRSFWFGCSSTDPTQSLCFSVEINGLHDSQLKNLIADLDLDWEI